MIEEPQNKRVVKLSNLKIGQKGKIRAVNINDRRIKRHLLDMGMVRGTIVEVKEISPFGDLVNIILRNYQLSIRKKDLEHVMVEVL